MRRRLFFIGVALLVLVMVLTGCTAGDLDSPVYGPSFLPNSSNTGSLGNSVMWWNSAYISDLHIDTLTSSLNITGPAGPAGPPGAAGAPGPNDIETTTTTNLTGLFKGVGGNIAIATPGIDYLDTSWIGSANLTTLGTITAGTWNGAVIPILYGGTGTNNGSITGTGNLTLASASGNPVRISASNGLNIAPGSDNNTDLITVGVTGAPKLSWDEANDRFVFSKWLVVTSIVPQYGVRYVGDDQPIAWGTSEDISTIYETADANANEAIFRLPAGGAVNVPTVVFGVSSAISNVDLGLNDGVTQTLMEFIEKGGQLHSATDGIADAGGATAILKHVGGFTNAVAGDDVRITAGTLCTAGWYKIITVTSVDQVTLDRNYTSGDTINITFVTYHSFPMIGANGVSLKTVYGAPSDTNVEIKRDGWLMLDTSQANGRLYWRANNAWHYVDATAGISLPLDERIDVNGHEFQIGDTIIFKVDKINNDGSFHAIPYYGGSN